jgi:hypothetical protein
MADTVLPRYKVDASGVGARFAPPPPSSTTPTPTKSSGNADAAPIASITKVMTATVFLENNPDLTQPVTIARSDVFRRPTSTPTTR